jgi:hypothetical protein
MKTANRCRAFQKQLIAELKARSFAELSALASEERLHTPPGFSDWKVYLMRSEEPGGGVKVTVEARKRSFLIFLSVSSPSFVMLPDGTVVEEPLVIDD